MVVKIFDSSIEPTMYANSTPDEYSFNKWVNKKKKENIPSYSGVGVYNFSEIKKHDVLKFAEGGSAFELSVNSSINRGEYNIQADNESAGNCNVKRGQTDIRFYPHSRVVNHMKAGIVTPNVLVNPLSLTGTIPLSAIEPVKVPGNVALSLGQQRDSTPVVRVGHKHKGEVFQQNIDGSPYKKTVLLSINEPEKYPEDVAFSLRQQSDGTPVVRGEHKYKGEIFQQNIDGSPHKKTALLSINELEKYPEDAVFLLRQQNDDHPVVREGYKQKGDEFLQNNDHSPHKKTVFISRNEPEKFPEGTAFSLRQQSNNTSLVRKGHNQKGEEFLHNIDGSPYKKTALLSRNEPEKFPVDAAFSLRQQSNSNSLVREGHNLKAQEFQENINGIPHNEIITLSSNESEKLLGNAVLSLRQQKDSPLRMKESHKQKREEDVQGTNLTQDHLLINKHQRHRNLIEAIPYYPNSGKVENMETDIIDVYTHAKNSSVSQSRIQQIKSEESKPRNDNIELHYHFKKWSGNSNVKVFVGHESNSITLLPSDTYAADILSQNMGKGSQDNSNLKILLSHHEHDQHQHQHQHQQSDEDDE